MAELARAKSAVKEWERAFRREAGRAPTKDDIKADPGDIAEQYALYRRLTKAQAAQATGGKGGSSSAASSRANAPRDRAEPTTPTPRRKARAASPLPSPVPAPNAAAGPSKRAAAGPPVTPQNKRIRYGPTVDPLPNPFSVTPKKNGGAGGLAPVSPFRSSARAKSDDSPFIFATSPRKLKDLLEANSLRKNRERLAAAMTATPQKDTPRTRARRRLAGESVESPAAKLRPPRRRGFPKAEAEGDADVFAGAAPAPTSDTDADDDDDEELEETPLKAGVFALVDEAPKAPGGASLAAPRSRGRDLFPMFRKAADATSGASSVRKASDGAEPSAARNGKRRGGDIARTTKRVRASSAGVSEPSSLEMVPGSDSPTAAPLPAPNGEAMDDDLVLPPSDASAPSTPPPAPPRPQRTPRRAHVLTLSDDEWDPEATPRTLRITGTRRAAVALDADVLASDDEAGAGAGAGAEEDEGEDAEGEEEDVEEEEEDMTEASDDAAHDAPAAAADASPRTLLSVLSLRSPVARAGERMADLRVRALLDPTSAAAVALKAMQRGQDVWACGELGGDEEDEEAVVVGDEGDDDWESDPEGWKAAPADDDW